MRLLCDGMLETKKPADRLIRGRMLRVSSLTSAQLPDAVANELHQLQPVLGQGKRKDKVAVELAPTAFFIRLQRWAELGVVGWVTPCLSSSESVAASQHRHPTRKAAIP